MLDQRFDCSVVAPFFVGAISSSLCVESSEWPPSPTPKCGANVRAGLSGRPSPLRERCYAVLLRGDLSYQCSAPVFVGAISLPLGVESAK